MLKEEMIEFLENQDFILYEDKESFSNAYPEPKWGEYRPQPNVVPESFPCMIRQECIMDNPNGADDAILSCIYV